MSVESCVNSVQRSLRQRMPKVWKGDNWCYHCPLERCENQRDFLDQRPKPNYDKICADNVGDEGWGAW